MLGNERVTSETSKVVLFNFLNLISVFVPVIELDSNVY